MNVQAAAYLSLCVLSCGMVCAAGDEKEKLLFGFELDELSRIAGIPSATKGPPKDVEGGVDLEFSAAAGGSTWKVRSAQASEGKYSLFCESRGESAYRPTIGSPRAYWIPRWPQPAEQLPYYEGLQKYQKLGLNTLGLMSRAAIKDWSGWDLLRFDVYCEGQEDHLVQVALEDDLIEPPFVRNVTVKAGKWVTVEVDLQAGAKSRGLDLRRIASLFLFPIPRKPVKAWFDNVRLCRAGTPARYGTVRDDSSLELPAYYHPSARPQPEVLPAFKPNHAPIKLQDPFLIKVSDKKVIEGNVGGAGFFPYIGVAPCGWAGAYDNDHLLLGFTSFGGGNCHTLQSLDGGKTWRGLDGGEAPTAVPNYNPDHGSGRGDIVGVRSDLLLMVLFGCSGPGSMSLRAYSQKLTFTDKGWQLRETPALVDCETRHCFSNQSFIRLPDGRLWCAYGVVGRLGTLGICARYSDDDGLIWKSWSPGTCGSLPGTVNAEEEDGLAYGTYTFKQPCLAPLGKGIACLWYELKTIKGKLQETGLNWSRFDGKTWTKPEPIPEAIAGRDSHTAPAVQVVGAGTDELYAVSARFEGVLHYAQGAWKKECPEIPPGSRISVAGGKKVVVIAAVKDGAGTILRSWQRGDEGSWRTPTDLAREDTPLFVAKNSSRPALVVQPYAPPNMVPIAWSTKALMDATTIKFLRVPVP